MAALLRRLSVATREAASLATIPAYMLACTLFSQA
jgi:hypothetical protein